MTANAWTADRVPDQTGATVFVTGATSGIGFEAAKLLATPGARVVTVSSLAHRSGRIAFDDLDATRQYSRMDRYAMSKLANLLFTYELQRRLAASRVGAIAVACHPGVTPTDLGRHFPRWLLGLLMLPIRWWTHSPSSGALPTVRAAADPDVAGGEYYGPSGRREYGGPPVLVESTPASHDEEAARRLWNVSEELTGVRHAL